MDERLIKKQTQDIHQCHYNHIFTLTNKTLFLNSLMKSDLLSLQLNT